MALCDRCEQPVVFKVCTTDPLWPRCAWGCNSCDTMAPIVADRIGDEFVQLFCATIGADCRVVSAVLEGVRAMSEQAHTLQLDIMRMESELFGSLPIVTQLGEHPWPVSHVTREISRVAAYAIPVHKELRESSRRGTNRHVWAYLWCGLWSLSGEACVFDGNGQPSTFTCDLVISPSARRAINNAGLRAAREAAG